jgi:hypothetical protein
MPSDSKAACARECRSELLECEVQSSVQKRSGVAGGQLSPATALHCVTILAWESLNLKDSRCSGTCIRDIRQPVRTNPTSRQPAITSAGGQAETRRKKQAGRQAGRQNAAADLSAPGCGAGGGAGAQAGVHAIPAVVQRRFHPGARCQPIQRLSNVRRGNELGAQREAWGVLGAQSSVYADSCVGIASGGGRVWAGCCRDSRRGREGVGAAAGPIQWRCHCLVAQKPRAECQQLAWEQHGGEDVAPQAPPTASGMAMGGRGDQIVASACVPALP